MSNDASGINSLSTAGKFVVSDTSTSSLDTAERLKLIREAFGFSQRELAKRAGVTNSSISMIEQGQVSPSVQSLTRILSAFPIGLADFFSFDPSNPAHIYRSGNLQLTADETGLKIQAFGSSKAQIDARIESLPTGQSLGFDLPATDICGLVLEGEVQLVLLSGTELLQVGDGFYIPARQPYQLSNVSITECRLFRCSLFVHKV
ncbi:helix-turn-helix domain-containing protein [Cellvibrio sp.]|uniref:helix-turn-helix domain-containing protein n=1 Tax=Cellvibrio sp. TaxID=1965322 RepID=UPI003F4BFEA0